MRKNQTLLFILPILLLVSACRKTENVVIPNQTIYRNITANMWTSSDNGKTYTADLDLSNDIRFSSEVDGILVYLSYSEGSYEQIPFTYDSTAFSYAVSGNALRIDAQDPLADVEIENPGPIFVKIVLIPSSE
ncbi:MAG: hypothetical protein INR69_15920 [Mucilaginibacter polytrichastri]|nr:hypothetical protein [Mucilaginibacter polytrichastri]